MAGKSPPSPLSGNDRFAIDPPDRCFLSYATMENEVSLHFDALADRWDAIAVHPSSRVDYVLSRLGDERGKTILDLGCGTGVLLPYLLGMVGPEGHVIALDISARMLGVARSKHSAPNLEFIHADFLSWVSVDKPDVIVAYSCFPHFREPSAFWQAASTNLRPGGRALVAHIEGRGTINALHARRANSVSFPLAPANAYVDGLKRQGFELEYSEDSEDYFILLTVLKG